MADVTLNVAAVEATPLDYPIPGAAELLIKMLSASYNGASAAGNFVPAVQLIIGGTIVAGTFPLGSTLAAGVSADVSWFPRVGSGAAGTIDDITSADGTVVVTDPTGPTVDLSVPAVKQDGWIPDTGDTWVYASGSGGGLATFTIAGDQTVKFPIGCRIKLTQSATVKYFVCGGASVTAGTTTVTIMAGTAYTLANATISAPFYSYQLIPQGYPSWFAYAAAPSGWSSFTSNQSFFSVVGGICYISYAFTGTSNSGTTQFSLPLTAGALSSAAYAPISIADNGTSSTTPGRASVSPGATVCELRKDWAADLFTASGQKICNGLLTYSLI